MVRGVRSVANINNDLAINSSYYDTMTPENKLERQKWFDSALIALKTCDLVFFDPDNGLSVKSIAYGKKSSSKYVFDSEIVMALQTSMPRSLVIYQHFPRIERSSFIRSCCKRLFNWNFRTKLICISTSSVLFLMIPHYEHYEKLVIASSSFKRKWNNVFNITKYSN